MSRSQDDWEPVQQYAVNNITQCQVQMVAHRKQGPVLPTLVVTISPDPATEKIRKRRSSRAATLVSNKDNGPSVLWFRTDGEAYKLHEWARCIQALIQPSIPENMPMSPMSPMTPASPFFQNPFVPHSCRDASDLSHTRPPSASRTATTLHHKASSSFYASRERPVTISNSPSLRSRRSDLSSLTSSNAPGNSGGQSHASTLPSDLPSPPLTAREPFGGFIEGWTAAHGRSSISNSPARPVRGSLGSGSVVSNPPLSPVAILESGSPPTHRETILDRAFQMNYIPGSEHQIPGEEKLSSLARFEALMQQVDAQRRKQSLRPLSMAQQLELKSAWDMDDSEDDEDDDSDAGLDDTEGELALEQDAEDDASSVRAGSRRAPDHAGGPKTPQQSPRGMGGPRSPIAFNPQTLAALSSGPDRPRFARRIPQQQHPHPHQHKHSHTLSGLGAGTMMVSSATALLDSSPGKSSIMSGESSVSDESGGGLNPSSSSAYRTSTIAEGQEQRHSAASGGGGPGGKRLSFGEFTKRLSTTSSMLIVQTNVPAASSSSSSSSSTEQQQQASESEVPSRRNSVLQRRQPPPMFSPPRVVDGEAASHQRHHQQRRQQQQREQQDRGEKCNSWRSSVGAGMLGNEGGFL